MSRKAIFNRSRLLLGDDTMDRMASRRVIIFGVGGVGSWCAEALVRSGVEHLTIVDSDRVCVTNINRQLMATTTTVGMVKVEALKERLLTINPDAKIDARQEIYSAETAADFNLEEYDYIIDCTDSLKDKAHLILKATRQPGRFYSSMGAALKIDPTKVEVTEFWKVKGCPLARALRQRFKKHKEYPAKKFLCVFSDELRQNHPVETLADADTWSSSKAQINGSLMHITAIFGLTLAGLIIQDMEKQR